LRRSFGEFIATPVHDHFGGLVPRKLR